MKRFLILGFTTLFYQSAWADCIYEKESYPTFETISVLDPGYTNQLKEQGISKDGYTLVLHCMPVIDVDAVSQGKFNINSIPVIIDMWVPSEIMISLDKPNIRYRGDANNNPSHIIKDKLFAYP